MVRSTHRFLTDIMGQSEKNRWAVIVNAVLTAINTILAAILGSSCFSAAM